MGLEDDTAILAGSGNATQNQLHQQQLPELDKIHQLSMSVGPIAATVLTAFLILLTMYCYKARTSSLSCVEDEEDADGLTSGVLRPSSMTEELEDMGGEGGGGGKDNRPSNDEPASNLGQIAIEATISPYRMNPGYFRPRPVGGGAGSRRLGTHGGAESSDDHGYSTMTPMSEVLLPQGPHPCIRTDPESSGTDVGIVSPYKMNPSYVRPQTTLGGAPSSSVAASLSTVAPTSECPLTSGCIKTDPDWSGTDVRIVSPYKMNPGYVRPQTTLGGAPSSSVAASLSTVAPMSEITKQFKFKDQSDLDVTGTLSESESTADKFDIRKDVNNHDSLPPLNCNQILVSATVHRSSD